MRLSDVIAFCFPSGLVRPRSFSRLLLVAAYGVECPRTKKLVFRGGNQGAHTKLLDYELKTMLNEVEERFIRDMVGLDAIEQSWKDLVFYMDLEDIVEIVNRAAISTAEDDMGKTNRSETQNGSLSASKVLVITSNPKIDFAKLQDVVFQTEKSRVTALKKSMAARSATNSKKKPTLIM